LTNESTKQKTYSNGLDCFITNVSMSNHIIALCKYWMYLAILSWVGAATLGHSAQSIFPPGQQKKLDESFTNAVEKVKLWSNTNKNKSIVINFDMPTNVEDILLPIELEDIVKTNKVPFYFRIDSYAGPQGNGFEFRARLQKDSNKSNVIERLYTDNPETDTDWWIQ